MAFGALSYNGNIRIVSGVDNGIVSKDKLSASKMIEYFIEEMESLKQQAIV